VDLDTRDAATQMAMGTVILSIFLAGNVSPLDSMPLFFWYVAQLVPTTWMIGAARGVILRGAGWSELGPHALVLGSMAPRVLVLTALRFQRRVA